MPDQGLSAETFEELALPLFDQLYNFARWLTHNAPEAEDLVQDTYVKALRGFSGFQLGTNFRAWMFRILRNTFLTSRTGLKSGAMSDDEVDFDSIAAATPNPESVFIAQANRELVRQGLTDLPVPYREVLLLCEVEEMSYEEIAQVLAVPIGTVMSRLYRARKALRALLAEKFKRAPNGL